MAAAHASPIIALTLLIALLAAALAAGDAPQARQAEGDTFLVAHQAEAPGPAPWNLTLDEVNASYPAVARALQHAGSETLVADGELEHVRAFFDEMSDKSTLVLDDQPFEIQLMMKSAPVQGDGDTAAKPVHGPDRMHIVVLEPGLEEPRENPLVLTLEEIEDSYPGILAALETPGRVVEVAEDQEAGVQALFDRMQAGAHSVIEVDGRLYSFGIAEASSGPAPASNGTQEPPADLASENEAPVVPLALLGSAVLFAALIGRKA